MGALGRIDHLGTVQGIRRAVIEGHHDVGPQVVLDLDGLLGGHRDATAVDDRLEVDPGLVDLIDVAHGENLVAARVGQDGTVPVHEAMQATELADDLFSGA